MYYYNKYWLNPISTIKQGKLGNKIVKNNFWAAHCIQDITSK